MSSTLFQHFDLEILPNLCFLRTRTTRRALRLRERRVKKLAELEEYSSYCVLVKYAKQYFFSRSPVLDEIRSVGGRPTDFQTGHSSTVFRTVVSEFRE